MLIIKQTVLHREIKIDDIWHAKYRRLNSPAIPGNRRQSGAKCVLTENEVTKFDGDEHKKSSGLITKMKTKITGPKLKH